MGINQQVNKIYQGREAIKRKSRPALPRDDLRTAYAGTENLGPSGSKEKGDFRHSTRLKARVTKESKTRTPIR